MAERNNQRQVRCQNQYVYDRLWPQKMSQVYHWLVPEEDQNEQAPKVTVAKDEKDCSHLRPSFF